MFLALGESEDSRYAILHVSGHQVSGGGRVDGVHEVLVILRIDGDGPWGEWDGMGSEKLGYVRAKVSTKAQQHGVYRRSRVQDQIRNIYIGFHDCDYQPGQVLDEADPAPEPPGQTRACVSGRAVSYTHLRAHETDSYLVCRLLLEK